MSNTRKLEKEREKRVAKELTKVGLPHEGLFCFHEGGKIQWFKVWVEFYPKVHWLAQEMTGLVRPAPVGPPQKVDVEFLKRLEDWL